MEGTSQKHPFRTFFVPRQRRLQHISNISAKNKNCFAPAGISTETKYRTISHFLHKVDTTTTTTTTTTLLS